MKNTTDDIGEYGEYHVRVWQVCLEASLLLAVAIWWLMTLRRKSTSEAFQVKRAIAWRSSVLFGLMNLPLILPSTRQWLIERPGFQSAYMYLPMWYAFNMSDTLGGVLSNGWTQIYGTLVGQLLIWPVNLVHPAGAACDNETCPGWWGGLVEYSVPLAIILATIGSYILTVNDQSVFFRRYSLGMFGALVVAWMNPNNNPKKFGYLLAGLTGLGFYPSDLGPFPGTQCNTLNVILIAIGLGFLVMFLPFPDMWDGGRGCLRFTCYPRAVRELSTLARDIAGILRITTEDILGPTSRFKLRRRRHFIIDLQRKLTATKGIIDKAWWEPCTASVDRQKLRSLAALLEKALNVLQSAHVQLIERPVDLELRLVGSKRIPDLLETFHREAAAALEACAYVPDPDDELLGYKIEMAHQALNEVLNDLSARLSQNEASSKMREGLISWMGSIRLLQHYLTTIHDHWDARSTEKAASRCAWPGSPHHAWLKWSNHKVAIKHTFGFLLALGWCVHHDYATTTISTYSFLIQSGFVLDVERDMSRGLGVSMGILAGELPNSIPTVVVGFFGYFCLAVLIWCVGIYGTLISTRRMYAVECFAAFSSPPLLKGVWNWNEVSVTHAHMISQFLYLRDMFAAVVISIIVDVTSSWATHNDTQKNAADGVSASIESSAVVVRSLSQEQSPDPEGQVKILGKVSQAESLQSVMLNNDFWQSNWRSELVNDILLECRRVAACAGILAIGSNKYPVNVKDLLSSIVDPQAAEDFEECARVCKALLVENSSTALRQRRDAGSESDGELGDSTSDLEDSTTLAFTEDWPTRKGNPFQTAQTTANRELLLEVLNKHEFSEVVEPRLDVLAVMDFLRPSMDLGGPDAVAALCSQVFACHGLNVALYRIKILLRMDARSESWTFSSLKH